MHVNVNATHIYHSNCWSIITCSMISINGASLYKDSFPNPVSHESMRATAVSVTDVCMWHGWRLQQQSLIPVLCPGLSNDNMNSSEYVDCSSFHNHACNFASKCILVRYKDYVPIQSKSYMYVTCYMYISNSLPWYSQSLERMLLYWGT